MDWAIRSAPTKPRKNSKKKKRRIKLGKGVDFSQPLKITICAKTVLDNCFWTQFTASVQGNEKDGFTIPGEYHLENYSRTMGKHNKPMTITYKEEQAQKRARLDAARGKAPEKGNAAAASKPAAAKKPAPPKRRTKRSSRTFKFGKKKFTLASGGDGDTEISFGGKEAAKKPAKSPALRGAKAPSTTELHIQGFSSQAAALFSADLPS